MPSNLFILVLRSGAFFQVHSLEDGVFPIPLFHSQHCLLELALLRVGGGLMYSHKRKTQLMLRQSSLFKAL